MTNEFIDVMAKRTDKELIEILTKYRNSYQPAAIIAAENECVKRNLTYNQDEIAKCKIKEDRQDIKIKKAKISNKRLSLYISLTYVGLGTIYSLLYWTAGNPMSINETFGNILFFIFIPVSIVSIGALFTSRDPGFFIVITQIITFLLVWALIYGITSVFRKEPKKSVNK